MMKHGAYIGSIVIQFTREVTLERFAFAKGETLVLNGKRPTRLTSVRRADAIDYCGSLIPSGSYKLVENYIAK